MRFILAAAASLLLLSGIPVIADEQTTPPMVGGDVDSHGCRPSAGYQWCERTRQCERSWELAKSEGLENTSKAFKEFCSG